MFARSLATVLLLTSLLTGCIGGLEEELDPQGADALADPERLTLDYEGTASFAQPAEHAVEVPADALEIALTVTSEPSVSVNLYGPSGSQIASTSTSEGPIHVFRAVLEDTGEGSYVLEVFPPLASGEVSYHLEGELVTGQAPEPTVLQPSPVSDPTGDGVVVAVVDTGINVYHEAFRATGAAAPQATDAVNDAAPLLVPVTLSESRTDGLRADDPTWRALEPGVLYRFEGTRVLGISMVEDVPWEHYPVLDESGHGTATSATVLSQAPDATIVMVEVSATSWSEIARAIEWTAQQPWIDVVSVSMGNLGNLPNPLIAGGDPDNEVPKASQAVVDSGKLYVNSAGNDPSFHYTDNADGPPWAVSVSGSEASTRGRDVIPSNGPDFVANFTVDVATHDSMDETDHIQGTSFSAPTTAGAFAQAILELRQATGHQGGISHGLLVDADGLQVSNQDLREAFNRSAIYWDATDWDPTNAPGNSTGTQLLATSTPILPTPYVQMGWGHVDAMVADTAAQGLLGQEDLPEKSVDAQAYMEQQQELRRTYWTHQMGR